MQASGWTTQTSPASPSLPPIPIAALLTFNPVARKVKRPDGWTDDLQRELIARLAATGTLQAAAFQMGKRPSGAEFLYRTPGADSFRAAWDAALAIGRARNGLDGRAYAGEVPGVTRRASGGQAANGKLDINGNVQAPGQVINECGEWEDEQSYFNRADEAKGRIARKLLRVRRMYLAEISASPGKRAAFEILTELPIDWDKAERLEPQPDEPYRDSNQRKPDMILTAESGWTFGDIGYGPNRMEQAREAIDAYRAEEGLGPIDWSAEDSDAD